MRSDPALLNIILDVFVGFDAGLASIICKRATKMWFHEMPLPDEKVCEHE